MTRKQIFDLQTLFLFYFLEYKIKIISMEKNIHKRFLECCKTFIYTSGAQPFSQSGKNFGQKVMAGKKSPLL
jgi:hypothetical protein